MPTEFGVAPQGTVLALSCHSLCAPTVTPAQLEASVHALVSLPFLKKILFALGPLGGFSGIFLGAQPHSLGELSKA